MNRRRRQMTSLIPIVRNAGEGDKQSFVRRRAPHLEAARRRHRRRLLPVRGHDGEGQDDAPAPPPRSPRDDLRPRRRDRGAGRRHSAAVFAAAACRSSPKASPTPSSSSRPRPGSSPSSPPAPSGQAFYRGASDPAVDDTADIVDIARLQTVAAQNPTRHQTPRTAPICRRSRALSAHNEYPYHQHSRHAQTFRTARRLSRFVPAISLCASLIAELHLREASLSPA